MLWNRELAATIRNISVTQIKIGHILRIDKKNTIHIPYTLMKIIKNFYTGFLMGKQLEF